MTPRERVLAALAHREPDCVPIDCGATMCTTLTLVAEEKLKEHLGLRVSGEAITNALTESVDLPEQILARYGVDFRTVRMKGPGPAPEVPAGQPARTAPGHEITDEFGTVWRKTWHDYVPMVFSYAEATLATLDRMPMPDPYDPGRVRGVREEACALRRRSDCAIVCDFTCGGPFEQAQRIRGFEQFMVDIALDRPFAAALMERLTDNAIGFWDAMLAEVGDCVDVVCQGDDLGMQTGLQISEADYRALVKPCHRRLFDFIHSRTAAKVWLHSCGAVSSIIPDLAEVGVDALNPVQTSATGMALARLEAGVREGHHVLGRRDRHPAPALPHDRRDPRRGREGDRDHGAGRRVRLRCQPQHPAGDERREDGRGLPGRGGIPEGKAPWVNSRR